MDLGALQTMLLAFDAARMIVPNTIASDTSVPDTSVPDAIAPDTTAPEAL